MIRPLGVRSSVHGAVHVGMKRWEQECACSRGTTPWSTLSLPDAPVPSGPGQRPAISSGRSPRWSRVHLIPSRPQHVSTCPCTRHEPWVRPADG